MEFYEIAALMKYSFYKSMEGWEQSRMTGFITAKSNGAKINKIEDLIKFPWEKKQKSEPVFMSEEKMASMRERAKSVIASGLLGED